MTDSGSPKGSRWLVLASAFTSFLAVGLGFFSVPPLIPALTGQFGLDNLHAGALMGSIAIPAILLSIPLGLAVDRLAPRPAGSLALVAMALGCACFAAASGFGMLLAGRIVFGIGGLVVNLLQARLLARAFAGREASLAMGVFLAAYPVSMIVCFAGFPALAAAVGWRGELGLLALLSLLAIPLHLWAVGPIAAAAPPTVGATARPRFRPGAALVALALAWCLYFAAFTPLLTFAPAWAGTSGLLIVSTIAWISLVTGPLAGGLIDRSGGPRWWAFGGTIGLAATLAAMAAGAVAPMTAMLLAGAVAAVVPTAVYSLPAQLVRPDDVGLAFGVITSLSNLGTVVGPALAGALRDADPSWSALWWALAAITAAAAVIVLAARPSSPTGSQRSL